jgi:hypothetical protein
MPAQAAPLVAAGGAPALLEQVRRHVAEDDASVRAEAIERTKPDQPGPATYVKQHVAGL